MPVLPPTSPVAPYRGWTAEDAGTDAFGQTGVRQYFGRAIMWLAIIGAVLTSAVWYRSTFYFDSAEWRAKDQSLRIRSIHGRLTVDMGTYPNQRAGSGWSYRGGYVRHVQDGWNDSIWKLIGIEFSTQPLDGTASAGFWLRIKWGLVFAIMVGVASLRAIVLLVRRWREARR